MTRRARLGRHLLFGTLIAGTCFAGCGSEDGKRQVPRESENGGEGGDGTPVDSGGSQQGGKAGGGGASSGRGGMSSSPGGEAGDGGTLPTQGGNTGIAGTSGSGGTSPEQGGDPGLGGEGGTELSGNGGAGGDASVCVPTQNSRITMAFDATNAEWVKNLQWLDSTNKLTANVAAFGGSSQCGEPPEYFGEAYGAPENTTPYIIVSGARATSVSCGLDVNIVSTPNNCLDAAQIPWTTEYHFYDGAKASQMRVTRTFGFNADTPQFTAAGLRPWQPRVPLAAFTNVIYPKADGVSITTTPAQNCPGDCITAQGAAWNGQWFADVTAAGLAIIIRRDPGMTWPVSLTINYDSFSSANLASFLLDQPAEGFKAPLTEVEYLCFADLTSWPQTERDAAQLPSWCGP